ncbi:iron-sulfur cluster assembly scaffold protein [Desulforhopalus singaporensis]|uniref:NifU homolog involved in Fe-S cluster formation n=1 Tax=Desulforhopalus singaporensis TaxID=91360 RepID=A0A1H0M0Q2_9BACT|nr:iron-sulfur cluster assembly scaffold protein [Desulforhopalus singaporensis]SDO73997.1 NifU homolog involved in Fe-S cluster formation [Desulforhopalus singaporensis]
MKENELDALVSRIQGEVFQEARNVLGKKGFDRWRNPRFCGPMAQADGYARLKGECGDTMEMYLKIAGERVVDVSYVTDGCSSSSIAGSFAAELATGKDFGEILDMKGSDVLAYIGHFPEQEEHCAHLAVRTLQEALNGYLVAQARAVREQKGELKKV